MKTIYDLGLGLMALAWLCLCFIMVPHMFKGEEHDAYCAKLQGEAVT